MKMSRALGLALRTPNRIVLAGAFAAVAAILANPVAAFASELDLKIPALDTSYMLFGASVSGVTLLMAGLAVCVLGMIFGLSMFNQVKGMPAHQILRTIRDCALDGRAEPPGSSRPFVTSTKVQSPWVSA